MKNRALIITSITTAFLLTLTGCANNNTPTPEQPTTPIVEETPVNETPSVDEINGELLGEGTTAEGLKIEVFSVGEIITTEDSGYQFEDGSEGYPAGTTVELLVYRITNTSTTELDIFGISTATSKFYESGYYAYTDFDADAQIEQEGYPTDLYEKYGFDSDTWPLAPNETVIFGEGWYHSPDRDGDLTLEFVTTGGTEDLEIVVKLN